MSIPNGYNVIKIPKYFKKQMQIVGKIKKVAEKKNNLEKSMQGDKSIPVIITKRNDFTFYKNQTYEKFATVPLVSNGWKSRKSNGDYFKIKHTGENPAFQHNSELFAGLGLNDKLVNAFNKLGFNKPTNIQTLAIPHILKGSNTIIAAETGNGKTYAYLAPLMQKVLEMKESGIEPVSNYNSPKAIIIVPGRELVVQTKDMARALGENLGLNINSLIGGRTKRIMEMPYAKKNTDIIIATFGALSKLTTTGIIQRKSVKYIVLDEADTLLDDSFNEKMVYYLSKFPIQETNVDLEGESPSGVQLTFVGATFPTSINSILEPILHVNYLVHVKTSLLHRVPQHVDQTFMRVLHDDKSEMLLTLAKKLHKKAQPTIVFCNTNKCCDYVSLFLNENGIPCTHFNGDMEFHQRIHKFQRFQNEEINFMACTDLASRGLDTVRAEHIINFDFPRFISDYIHRCGRTGRVGAETRGSVTSFVMRPDEVLLSQKIEYSVRKMEPLPNVNANIKRTKTARKQRKEEESEEQKLTKS